MVFKANGGKAASLWLKPYPSYGLNTGVKTPVSLRNLFVEGLRYPSLAAKTQTRRGWGSRHLMENEQF